MPISGATLISSKRVSEWRLTVNTGYQRRPRHLCRLFKTHILQNCRSDIGELPVPTDSSVELVIN